MISGPADGLAACGVWCLVTDQGSGYGRVQDPPDSVAPAWPLPRSPALHPNPCLTPLSGQPLPTLRTRDRWSGPVGVLRIITNQVRMNIYADSKRILDDQDLFHYLNSSYDTKKPINVVITETHLEAYIPHTYMVMVTLLWQKSSTERGWLW